MTYPKGWIVRLKKQAYPPSDQFDDHEQVYEKMRGKVALYTAFGEFDRVEFQPVDLFASFIEQTTLDMNWYGREQTILLYSLNRDDDDRVFGIDEEKGENAQNWLNVRGVTDLSEGRHFFALTMLYFTSEIKSLIEYEALIQIVQENIEHIVENYCEGALINIKYELYGSFNSAGIAILWHSREFVDSLFLVDKIKAQSFEYKEGKKINVFASTYTVIFARIDSSNRTAYSQAKGVAIVQFVSACIDFEQTNSKIKDLEKLLKDENGEGIKSIAGEYDYTCTTSFGKLMNAFEGKPIHSKEMMTAFRAITVQLGYSNNDVINNPDPTTTLDKIKVGSYNNLEKRLDVLQQIATMERENVNSIFNDIRLGIKELAPYSDIGRSLELLYQDYREIQSTAFDHLWAKDYHEQVISMLKIIKYDIEIIANDHTSEDIRFLFEKINLLTKVIQQQVNHIMESSKLFFQVPNSKVGYTSQFDLILHAFYGVTKKILSSAFEVVKSSSQHRLIPIINFSNTSIIASEMFCTSDHIDTNRVISIVIPYGSWSNFLYYTPYLFHELYHYIAPKERPKRNIVFLRILLNHTCYLWLSKDMLQYLGDKQNEEARGLSTHLVNIISLKIYNILNEYPEHDLLNLIKCDDHSCTAYTLLEKFEAWLLQEDSEYY